MISVAKYTKGVFLLVFLQFASLHSYASTGDNLELEKFKKAIRVMYDLKERAFATNDADLVVDNFYTADVVSAGEEPGVLVGREAIRPHYQAVIGDTVKVESVYTKVNGDMGWDWANFYVTPGDKDMEPFSFKILFLWEKVNGKWMCAGDMFVVGNLTDVH